MGKQSLIFQNVTFAYDAMSEPLLEDITIHLSPGWTAVIGPNGCGKSTFLKLASQYLAPDQGLIRRPAELFYCEQRTDRLPDDFQAMLESYDRRSFELIDRLQLEADWPWRWETLSHGERKRAQIAAALWREPDLLAIDEPTNHLDAEARQLVRQALQHYRGIGLLVSHDRRVLEQLCQTTLFLEPPSIKVRRGSVAAALQSIKEEQQQTQRDYQKTQKELKKVQKRMAAHRNEANRADQKRSKKGLARQDHDAKAKIDAARLTGKDATAGKRLNQMAGRSRQIQEQLNHIQIKKEYRNEIWMNGEASQKDRLFRLPEQALTLGEERRLYLPALEMKPTDRIALTGPNGCGKSTLLKFIRKSLEIPAERLINLPQELSEAESRQIIRDTARLPSAELGRLMTIVNALGSRPPRLLESELPSPGEVRKILLAAGIVRSPHLIIMDEPTNHLDLISIQCLEEVLTDCPCALLLVSHDQTFLSRMTTLNWQLQRHPDNPANSILTVHEKAPEK